MLPFRWIAPLCLVLSLTACQKQEEPPKSSAGPPAGVKIEEPTPAQKADQDYMTPQEGAKQDKLPLEVVDKNISLAIDQPTALPPSADPGPEQVIFEAKMGNVTFPHLAHGQQLQCTPCHGEGIPAKIVLNKDAAHALCRGCHEQQGAGPTKCADCHRK